MTTKTKTTKKTKRAAPAKAAPSENGTLRSTMRALAKRSLADLRTQYQHATGKDGRDLKRDALIKHLTEVTRPAKPTGSVTDAEGNRWRTYAPGTATVGEMIETTLDDAAKVLKEIEGKPNGTYTKVRERDPRIPATGTIIQKSYKDRALEVEVLDQGFRFEGNEYRSLTAVAMQVTGAKSINGLLFFGLTKRTPKDAAAAPTPAAEPPAAAEPKSPKKPKGARRAKRSGR